MASRFDVLRMALDEVAKRAPKVVDAVGDVVKNIDVAPVKEAVKRVADDVVKASDSTPQMLSQPVGYRARETGKGWQPLREHVRLENERGNKLFDTYKDYADDGYEVTWVAHTPEDAGAYTLSAKDIDAWKAGKLDVDLSDIDEVDLGGATLVGRDDEGGYLYIRRLAGSDDWGWKGGKPGEITSKDYWKKRDIIEKMGDTAAAEVRLEKLDNKVIEQFSKSKYPHIRGDEYSWSREQGPDEMMRMFASIEEAGVPRKWSGRFAEVTLKGDSFYDYSMIDRMADHMKSMTDAQRKTYLDTVEKITEAWGELLPGETSEETGRFVAEAAKAAQELTPSQLEEYWALLPEWTESLDDLANAVKNF